MRALFVFFLAVSCTPTNPRFAFNQPEQRGRLATNGLRFVVMPDATTQLVEVDVRYEVGSREDPPGKAGLAHLVEHLMFQHKPDGPTTKPLFHYLVQASIFVNAYTNWDTTHYMTSARADQLDSLVKIEAMRLHYGCLTISEDEFLRERDVVRNEIRGHNRTPEGLIEPLTLSAVYPKGHAYEQPIGGNDEQLATITLADACDFIKKYYAPERATVIVAGGVSTDAAVASIQKWFGKVAKRSPAPRHAVEPVAITAGTQTHELDIERPWVTVSWALPDATTPRGEAAQFAIWGAFFDAARKVDKYECATDAEPAIFGGQHAPVFTIALELKSLERLDECLDLVWKSARQVHRGWDGATWSQLEESKNRRKAAVIASLEPLMSRTNYVGELVQFTRDFDFNSRDRYIYNELDKIGKFDIETVGTAVKGLLDRDRARVVVFKPSKRGLKGDRRAKIKFQTKSHETEETPEVDPSEARRPIKVATELKSLAGAQRFQLANGMRVVLLPLHAWPVISAQLIFDVGEASTPTSPALAASAAELLQPPADGEAQARTGVRMRCDTTADHTICTARGMNIYLDVVVKGLERLIRAGNYDQESVEELQKKKRIAFKLKRTQERVELHRQRLSAVFGPDHPYTRTAIKTPAAYDRLGRDALSAFRDEHYTAANATLVLVGDFDAAKAEALIRENFGEWERGRKDAPIAKTPFPRVGPAYVGVIESEPDPQVDVAIVYPSPAAIDGQHAARLVLAEMLDAKMWDIRAKLGATYGTYAYRDTRLGPSTYTMGGAVDAPRAGEALKAMRDSISGLRSGQHFEITFVRARRKVLQQLLGESTMTAELADRLGEIARFSLDRNYYNTLLQQVAAVSPAQVRALLAKELEPTNEVVVTLGDRTSVTKAFADAGIRDIKLVEPDYR